MAKPKTKQPTKLDDLKPDPDNPRKISKEAADGLRYSLDEFGDLSGITFNSKTQELVCGHQRVSQLKQIGVEFRDGALWVNGKKDDGRFPVRVVDWSRSKQRAANRAANSRHLAGEFDPGAMDLEAIKLEIGEDAFAALRFDKLDDTRQVSFEAKSLADGLRYSVIVDFDKEKDQQKLLEELEKRGFACRLLIS